MDEHTVRAEGDAGLYYYAPRGRFRARTTPLMASTASVTIDRFSAWQIAAGSTR